MPKRRADLSESALKKLIRCENFMEKEISSDNTPEACLKLLKKVCEERNAALQGHERALAEWQMGDSYFRRDVRKDIALFMRCLKRKLGGELSDAYSECELYFYQQKRYFKNLRRIRKKKSAADSSCPGKTSFNQAGIYNGLA